MKFCHIIYTLRRKIMCRERRKTSKVLTASRRIIPTLNDSEPADLTENILVDINVQFQNTVSHCVLMCFDLYIAQRMSVAAKNNFMCVSL